MTKTKVFFLNPNVVAEEELAVWLLEIFQIFDLLHAVVVMALSTFTNTLSAS